MVHFWCPSAGAGTDVRKIDRAAGAHGRAIELKRPGVRIGVVDELIARTPSRLAPSASPTSVRHFERPAGLRVSCWLH